MVIFITGYMCAGKTMLGKQLAERLDYLFLDLDEMIELSTGYAIRDYFEKFGENSFREKERQILLGHLNDNRTVIATGGGTACYADNMDLMNQNGITVFIETSIEIIMKRLSGGIHLRPLLADISPGQLPSFIEEHMGQRHKFYSKALIKVNGEDVDIDGLIYAVRNSI